jgi:hypothetical protein
MTTPRRDFLSWLGAGGVLAAGGVPKFRAAGAGHHPLPVSDTWDLSWCDRVNGKVRAVFDSPAASEGDAMFRAQVWREEQQEVYGTPVSEASAVLVFRHQGISMVMKDAYWARFGIGKHLKIKDAKGKQWVTGNPIASTPPGGPEQFANYNLPAFMASGGIVLACNYAFGESVVSRFKKADKLSDDDARKRAMEFLIPGVILQPSGVFATLRAQQAGCHYLLAS